MSCCYYKYGGYCNNTKDFEINLNLSYIQGASLSHANVKNAQ